jgi:cytidyltransferase-like protein
MKKVVITSGYFNPVHIGHIRLLKAAKLLGDFLVVIVNNDKQQLLKKGKIIMSENERTAVVDAIKFVDKVVLSKDEDPTVRSTLEMVAMEFSGNEIIFANGGDRKDASLIPETSVCERYKIKQVFDVGGNDKPNSSSNINKLLGRE